MLKILAIALLACLACSAGAQTKPAKSLAERLGYKATDKLLIIHADDAGMCHSVNVATIRAMEKGVVTSASIMVPCPWFPEIAAYCRENPNADFGIHLTLTSEWKTYRWKPVVPADQVPGLIDGEGFIHRSVEATARAAKPEEVEKEIRAQVARALQFGIKPTHVDTHMGTLFAAPFHPVYHKVARDTGFPAMLVYPTPERIKEAREVFGFEAVPVYEALRKEGFVFLDVLKEDASGSTLETRREHYYQKLRDLKPGVTQFIVHLSLDDDEIRSITGNWAARWHEYQILTDPRTRELIDSLGIKLIGWRELARVAFKPED